jgi:hypothetical protein
LREQAIRADIPETELDGRRSPRQIVFIVVALTLFGGLLLAVGCWWLSPLGALVLTAYTLSVATNIWLLVLIARECAPDAFVLALVFPFYTWFFAIQRWDIARWPFLCHLAGFAIWLGLII